MRLYLLHSFVLLNRDSPREPEVTQSYTAVMVYKDVGGFDITVHDPCCVQKVHCAEQIINQVYYVLRGKGLHLFRDFVEYFSEVALHVLHYHEQVLELELGFALQVIVLADYDVIELSGKFVTFHLGKVS